MENMVYAYEGVDVICEINGVRLGCENFKTHTNLETGRIIIEFNNIKCLDSIPLPLFGDIVVKFLCEYRNKTEYVYYRDMKCINKSFQFDVADRCLYDHYIYEGFICETTAPPRKWLLHNLIGHPVSGILECLGMNKLADLVHDKTLPRL